MSFLLPIACLGVDIDKSGIPYSPARALPFSVSASQLTLFQTSLRTITEEFATYHTRAKAPERAYLQKCGLGAEGYARYIHGLLPILILIKKGLLLAGMFLWAYERQD